jgi:glycosyltransferase involved in cell wall biosynthesis
MNMENFGSSTRVIEDSEPDFKFISVVIPAHNEQKYISECLKSLISQDYPKNSYEIIVVDNNSSDKTQEIAIAFGVKIINQKSGPVGTVRNTGANQAIGEFLAFIDADCVAPESWLSRGVQLLLTDLTVHGGGCNLRPHPFWMEKAWLLESKEPPKDLLGGCIFIRKSDFLLVGSFDETITAGEDTKLSVALRNRNYQVIMTEELNVIHLGNPTTVKSFFLRQVWHSENYLQNWSETVKDPTFYLLSLFLVGIILFFSSIIHQSVIILVIGITLVATIPSVFTLKRLLRSRDIHQNLRNLPAIYFLDFIYLSGRVFGLVKSVWTKISSFIAQKIFRED